MFSLIKHIIAEPVLVYLHPFGSTGIENIESFNGGDSGPVLFCYDQEPLIPGFNDALFAHIKECYKNRTIILLNTERSSTEKNYFLDKFGFVDCYYFFHIFAAHDWFRGYRYCADITPLADRKISKKYITFNRLTGNERSYRSLFVAELARRNLLSHGHVSYSDICPEHGHYTDNLTATQKRHNLNENYVKTAMQELDNVSFPLRIDYKDQDSIPNHSMLLGALPESMESFLYVVTETCYWSNKEHLTEKIFKPILTKQPFVLLGCSGNLNYLKSYGFKTFDAWWDESYDSITDPIQRLQAVVKIIDSICSRTDQELEQMLSDMTDVLDYNYTLFNSQCFLDSAWREMSNNLTYSVNNS